MIGSETNQYIYMIGFDNIARCPVYCTDKFATNKRMYFCQPCHMFGTTFTFIDLIQIPTTMLGFILFQVFLSRKSWSIANRLYSLISIAAYYKTYFGQVSVLFVLHGFLK